MLRAYPARGPGLRDSGQLEIAQQLCERAGSGWRARLEVPAGDFGRAADLVFFGPDEILHVEIERAAVDFQAQFQAAVGKREVLAATHARPVRLILAIEDTGRNRSAVQPYLALITDQLPAGSRAVLTALRTGAPLDRDGLLWVRRGSGQAPVRSIGPNYARG